MLATRRYYCKREPMHSLNKTLFSVAALLAIGVSAASHAADLALPFYTPAQRALLDSVYEVDADSVQVLGMEPVDVWDRLRKGFAIPDLENPLVGDHSAWYAARPDYIHRTTLRASRYLFHVVQELEKRGMPTELALLPFIESAFNPQAYSSAHAAGMWQFIPSTGLAFNLTQSVFKDERRDVLASTDAALTYLQQLHDMFGDWHLALAAYNWGEGSVRRAIRKNRAAGRPIDFNGLSHLMPAETRNYVPKLQAVKNLIATPDQYALSLPKVDNQPYFVTIGKTRDIDIKVAAQLAELSIDEFKALNPQFNRPVITGGADTKILLPHDNAEKFKANLAKWTRALSSWTAHKVTAARERVETIAARFNTTPEIIREVNNIPPRMALRAGSTILVPKLDPSSEKDISPELVANAVMAVEPERPVRRRVALKVGRGDTLSSIARRNRVSVTQIKAWNNLRSDHIVAGQKLLVEVVQRTASAGKKARKSSAGRTRASSQANVRRNTKSPSTKGAAGKTQG
jgi:membrane-bound lytic murein transglycosylase D